MQRLVKLGILVGMLSCSGAPSGTTQSSPPAGKPQKAGGDAEAQQQAPSVPILRADVNEDGEVNVLDLTAVSHYVGQKVPADAAVWKFSDETITIGEPFWVRVDLAGGKTGEQMDFELSGCGDYFLVGSPNDSTFGGNIVHGSVGGLERLIILNDTGKRSIPSNDECKLTATAIRRGDGRDLAAVNKKLKFQAGAVSLSGVDLEDLRQGRISAKVKVDANVQHANKQYVNFYVCKANTSDNFCKLIGETGHVPYPSSGTVSSLQLKKADGSSVDSLASGKYLVMAFYTASKASNMRLAAFAIEID